MARGQTKQSGSREGSAQSVNINTASLEELTRLHMVGKDRAQEIINFRNEHGPFRSWEDLDQVPGFSKGMIEDIRKSGATLGGD